MAVAVDEAQKFKTQWLEAKARNSELSSRIEDFSRELKKAQEAQEKAEQAAAEAEALKAEYAASQEALAACQTENASLIGRLSRAKKQVAAAQKIAEGLAELG